MGRVHFIYPLAISNEIPHSPSIHSPDRLCDLAHHKITGCRRIRRAYTLHKQGDHPAGIPARLGLEENGLEGVILASRWSFDLLLCI